MLALLVIEAEPGTDAGLGLGDLLLLVAEHAEEAADAVTGYAFEVLGWPFLYLTNAVDNVASRRVKEKQGAELLGQEPWAYVANAQGMRDTWRLTREAWFARNDT